MRERLLELLIQHTRSAREHGITESTDADRILVIYPDEDFLVVPGRTLGDEPVTMIVLSSPEAREFWTEQMSGKNWLDFERELVEKLAE